MRRHLILTFAALAGFAVASAGGSPGANSFTLQLAKGAKVTNQSGMTKSESIAVTPHGFAVYTLERGQRRSPEVHLGKRLLRVLASGQGPRAPSGLTKPPGIKGKLGTWHRNGIPPADALGTSALHVLGRHARRTTRPVRASTAFGGIWHPVSEGSSVRAPAPGE